MAEPLTHLHLFPTEFPKDQVLIVLNKIRGIDDGKSARDQAEAAWWVAGYGMSLIPDNHPPMMSQAPMSGTQLVSALEGVGAGEVEGIIPWDMIVTKLWQLFLEWIQNK